MRTYAEHLDAWEEIDRLGYDGLGFNEHHCSPYGLMNSPNLMAASAAQRTKTLKLLIYGNLLPLHEPLRLAEELAMLDCLSNGRLISGFARGIPREYQVHNVPLAEFARPLRGSLRHRHPRLDRGRVLLPGQVLVVQGRRVWPRPVQQPHPPIWMPDRRQQGIDRVRRASTTSASRRASAPRRAAGRHHPLLREMPRREWPSHHARPSVARRVGLRRRQQGAGGEGDAAPICCISTARCSATATSPRPASSASPATRPTRRPTMCARRTSVPASTRARISAT